MKETYVTIIPSRRQKPYRRKLRKPSIKAYCRYCNKIFHPTPSRVKNTGGFYCSVPCFNLDKRRPYQERFWDFVDKSGACWIWTGSKIGGKRKQLPYGKFTYAPIVGGPPVTIVSHRMAWQLLKGPIPDGLNVLHKCDNPPCVNPDHLFPGTNQDNVDDMISKGRKAVGELAKPKNPAIGDRNSNSKLNEKDVIAIRSRYSTESVSQSRLAAEYGVCQTVISSLLLRKTWKHI